MKKILFIALTAFAAAAHAETATQSLDLQNTTVKTTGTSNFTAPGGQTMHLVNTAVSVSSSTVSASANANTGQLLSMQTVKEGDIDVSLPTVRNADGSICVSYVSSASREHDDKLDADKLVTVVSKVCGMPATSAAAYPANLRAMRLAKSGDLAVQLPEITVQ